MQRTRLTRDDWIRAAYGAFETGGVESVQVEPLCRALRVSKGSFYWHFADRAALLDSLLQHWSRQTSQFRLQSEVSGQASESLEGLAEAFAAAAGQRADRAMMRWARRDPRVAPTVSRVLKRRLDYVARLLRAHGLSAGEAAWRAKVISFAYMGWLEREGPTGASTRATRDWLRRLTALALAPASAPSISGPQRIRHATAARRRRTKK